MTRLPTIFLIVFTLLMLNGCATLSPNFEKPDLQLTNLTMLSPQGLEQRFRLSFRVTNPNNIRFPVDGISFHLTLRDIKVASGVTNESFELAPLGESEFDVDVSASLFNSGRVLLDIINKQPTDLAYEINAKIFTSKGILGSIPVTRKGVISLSLNQGSAR